MTNASCSTGRKWELMSSYIKQIAIENNGDISKAVEYFGERNPHILMTKLKNQNPLVANFIINLRKLNSVKISEIENEKYSDTIVFRGKTYAEIFRLFEGNESIKRALDAIGIKSGAQSLHSALRYFARYYTKVIGKGGSAKRTAEKPEERIVANDSHFFRARQMLISAGRLRVDDRLKCYFLDGKVVDWRKIMEAARQPIEPIKG